MRFFFLLFVSVFFLQGCGYSVRMMNGDEQRRETEDKKELEARVARLDSEMAAMKEEVARFQEENRQGVASLQKRRADMDVRLDEGILQIRMIQGTIEKEGHRLKELAHQVENIAFRVNDLGEARTRLADQEKKWDSIQKALQGQIDSIKVGSGNLQKSSEQQAKKLEEISDQVLELAEKIPPALNAQAVLLNDLGKQFEKMTKGADAEEVNKTLVDLSDALNVLGEKITAKVDEQQRLLEKMTKRLQALEAKLAPGKRSALPGGDSEGFFSQIYYELGAGYYELNDPGRAREAFERARERSGQAAAASSRTFPVEGSEE